MRARIRAEQNPEEEASRAEVQAGIDKHEADSAEAKERKAAAEARMSLAAPAVNLPPEKYGELIGGLVTKLVEGGVEPKRAYLLALQALSPEAPATSPGQVSNIESKMVMDYFNDLREEVKNLRAQAAKPPSQTLQPPPPVDPLVQMQNIVNMGENYMRLVFGLTPEDIARLKSTPDGINAIQSVGGNLETQLHLIEFMDERKQAWFKFEREMQEWKNKQNQETLDAESKRKMREGMTEGVRRVGGALARALEAVSKKKHQESIEETAESTGVNPTCNACGGELAVDGAPEGWAVCTNCGKGIRLEEIGE